MKTLIEQLHDITLKQDLRVVSLDQDTARGQTFDFYYAVVIPAFGILKHAFRNRNDFGAIRHSHGMMTVSVCHEARQHSILYMIRTQQEGMKLRVQSSMSISDHLKNSAHKTQMLFGCKHKALADISQEDIIQGFIHLYDRMLSSEE